MKMRQSQVRMTREGSLRRNENRHGCDDLDPPDLHSTLSTMDISLLSVAAERITP
jgi:hypothetical protein